MLVRNPDFGGFEVAQFRLLHRSVDMQFLKKLNFIFFLQFF
jgi:hypothetical protein